MNKFVALVFAGLVSSQAQAASGITVDGHTACLSREWLDDIVSFAIAGDRASSQSYKDTQKCVVLKGGLRVTVTGYSGLLGGITVFVYDGVKFWTLSNGIKSEK